MLRLIHYENILYWLTSLLINLILFTFMSLVFLIKGHWEVKANTLNLFIQEPILTEFKTGGNRGKAASKGEVPALKGRQRSLTSPIKAGEHGDYEVPKAKEEPSKDVSVLAEVEKEVKSRRRQANESLQIGSKEVGSLTVVVGGEGVGLSSTGGRAVVHTPPIPKIVADEPPSPIRVRIWVEPSGVVSRVEILQRSGVPSVDRKILDFVKGVKFEPVEGQVQTGILTFKFKGG